MFLALDRLSPLPRVVRFEGLGPPRVAGSLCEVAWGYRSGRMLGRARLLQNSDWRATSEFRM